MHILIAPNAFKGSLSAEKAAYAIEKGLQQSGLPCQTTLCPIADGGDDTVSLLTKRTGGKVLSVAVHDPLGRMITSTYGWLEKDKKAFIGVSNVSGLRLLNRDELDPLRASSYGTGELIMAALKKGAQHLIIAVGGSATVDGGIGLLTALGIRLIDKDGKEMICLPLDLPALAAVDTNELKRRLNFCEITVLCDVKNKLLGIEGAATIYGPQKGANPEAIVQLESSLHHWNEITRRTTSIDMASLDSGGAAGGIAAGLAAYTGAKLVDGINYFLDMVQFDQLLKKADIVITAEGSIDVQTLSGKGPFGVASRAKAKGIPVIGMAGYIPPSSDERLSQYFDRLIAINPPEGSLQEAMDNTATNLTRTALELGKLLKTETFI